jgi:hypothetical protein
MYPRKRARNEDSPPIIYVSTALQRDGWPKKASARSLSTLYQERPFSSGVTGLDGGRFKDAGHILGSAQIYFGC